MNDKDREELQLLVGSLRERALLDAELGRPLSWIAPGVSPAAYRKNATGGTESLSAPAPAAAPGKSPPGGSAGSKTATGSRRGAGVATAQERSESRDPGASLPQKTEGPEALWYSPAPGPSAGVASQLPAGDEAASGPTGDDPGAAQTERQGFRQSSPGVPAVGADLESVRVELGDCARCGLAASRRHIVFGEGNPQAKLVFVGEAPGGDEDLQGRPFVGRAGQLLTKIIVAMGLTREDVYICNILKCRPPGNRNPLPDEIAACEPFLLRQLAAIEPRVICALGSFAARTLLRTDVPITVLRGRFHEFHGKPLMPTYHPAYLLRNPGAKKLVWEDVQKIIALLKR